MQHIANMLGCLPTTRFVVGDGDARGGSGSIC